MNEYINILREIAEEAQTLARRLGEEKARTTPAQLSVQELHSLRVRLADLNRRSPHAPHHSHT